jgi:hypothetical protein
MRWLEKMGDNIRRGVKKLAADRFSGAVQHPDQGDDGL